MYKKQMTTQKILCLLAVVVAVILFLYSLGIMTDLYDTLYTTLRIRVVEGDGESYSLNVTERDVPGARVYTNMQEFNRWLVSASIVYILLAVLLFVTNTNIRRRYYIGNYVSIGLFAVASFYIPLSAHGYIEIFKAQWQAVDFAALQEYADAFNSAYTESTLWFDLHYGVFALMIIAALLLAACAVWKVMLMKEEASLVATGKGVHA